MKAHIHGIEIEGTPEEMSMLIQQTTPKKITAQQLVADAMKTISKRKQQHAKGKWNENKKKWTKTILHDIYTYTETSLLKGMSIKEIDTTLAKRYNVSEKTITVKRSEAGATVYRLMNKHRNAIKKGQ